VFGAAAPEPDTRVAEPVVSARKQGAVVVVAADRGEAGIEFERRVAVAACQQVADVGKALVELVVVAVRYCCSVAG